MADVLSLLALAFVVLVFWRFRQQAEWARAMAERLCKVRDIQLLDVALSHRQLTRHGLVHHYTMDVSLGPSDRYQAHFVMRGRRLLDCQWPVMRETIDS